MLRLYVNGTQVGSANVTGAYPNSQGPLQIGGNRIWSEWFQGQIDDLRVYNRALSATELQNDMNTPVGGGSPPPPPPPPADTQAPSAPNGLAVSGQSQNGLTLTWNAATDNVGVTGYGVYRNGTSVGSTSATTRTFGFTGLACGTTYGLAVDAVDAAGNRSGRSTVNGTTSACTPPPVPPGSGLAQVWVDVGGGLCVRSAVGGGVCGWAGVWEFAGGLQRGAGGGSGVGGGGDVWAAVVAGGEQAGDDPGVRPGRPRSWARRQWMRRM